MKRHTRVAALINGLLIGAAVSAPAVAGIQDMLGYQGIRVYEATFVTNQQANFASGDSRLTSVLSGSALSFAGRDFGFWTGNENYDLYFSNADGSLNAHGSYLTIDGNCDVVANCFNITEAAVRVSGADQLATGVVRAVYGRPGSYPSVNHSLAADGNFGTFTQLGDTTDDYPNARMSITLSFANVPAVPEPEFFAMMLAGLGVLAVAARRRKPKVLA